jgi:glycosyltransferase involved in cell wall biosynthesis
VPEPWKVYFEMPAWNIGKYVGAAINSIAAQTYPGCQVIVVDDGSTDDTMASASAALADPRLSGSVLLTHPNHEHKQNVASANLAIEEALRRGADIIARLDGDDSQDPTRIAKQVAVLLAGADIVSTSMYWMTEAGQLTHAVELNCGMVPERYGSPGAHEPPGGSIVAWARVYREIGLFDPVSEWAPDSEWNFRVLYADKYTWGHVPEPLYWYRHNRASTTRTNPGRGNAEYQRLSELYRSWLVGGKRPR